MPPARLDHFPAYSEDFGRLLAQMCSANWSKKVPHAVIGFATMVSSAMWIRQFQLQDALQNSTFSWGLCHPPPRASAVRWPLNAKAPDGDNAIRRSTLRTNWKAELERILRTDWRRSLSEATCRSPKSHLGLRPIWQPEAECIRAHLSIAVPTHHRVPLQRWRPAAGLHHSWQTIRRQLAACERITTTLRTARGRLINNPQHSRPTPDYPAIARAGGVTTRLERRRK